MKPETQAIHAPGRRDGELAASIRLATTYEHGPAYEVTHGFTYTRGEHPNLNDFEARLAALEGGAAAAGFGSGMAAATAILTDLPEGARVVFHEDMYFAVANLTRTHFERWGLEACFADLRDEASLAKALEDGAALIWAESPTNPRLSLLDLARLSQAAHAAGAQLVVDNTFCSPALQTPLALGADIVMHSATKYMGGHSDVMGGAVTAREADYVERLRVSRDQTGAVLAPFNAWLIARGLQTLYCRMERHSANGLAVADFLSGHGEVARVNHPFLGEDADLAQRQMRGGGGMLSFELAGGREAALAVAGALKLFTNATSLGGVESLVEHRASTEGALTRSPQNLLRLSVGLEHEADLIADLDQALSTLG